MSGVKPSPKKAWIKKSVHETAGKKPDGAGLAKILTKPSAKGRYGKVHVKKGMIGG